MELSKEHIVNNKKSIPRIAWVAAASIVIVAAYYWFNKSNPAPVLIKKEPPSIILQAGREIIRVPQGTDYKLTLSDSTKVWINAATQFSFPVQFTGNTREVTVDGEVYFEVAQNSALPFIVRTKTMKIEVLGTEFNLKAYENEKAQASLVTGSIKATNGDQELMVGPGSAAIVFNGRLSPSAYNPEEVLAWRKGSYYFDQEPLSVVSRSVNRWFGYRFNFNDTAVANFPFTGTLQRNQPIEQLLQHIRDAADIIYTINGRDILLQKK